MGRVLLGFVRSLQIASRSASARLVSPAQPYSAAVAAAVVTRFARVFDVAVGAAGEAEVGVVELAERGPVRGLQLRVDVVRGREPLFGLVVVAEHGGGSCEWPRNGTD